MTAGLVTDKSCQALIVAAIVARLCLFSVFTRLIVLRRVGVGGHGARVQQLTLLGMSSGGATGAIQSRGKRGFPDLWRLQE